MCVLLGEAQIGMTGMSQTLMPKFKLLVFVELPDGGLGLFHK